MKVLIADNIGEKGVEILREKVEVDIKTGLKPEELIEIIPDYEALLVRSETKVTAEVIEAGKKLQVIGRAGVGVDNVNIEAATKRGIIVVNAPAGNTRSAAEHTIALMTALARNIPQAHAQLKAGKWDRKRFTGVEVFNKKLGVIGLGRVGTEVARRGKGLGMQVIAYDPMIALDYAKSLGVEPVSLEQLLQDSDFITVHVPLSEETRCLIGEEALRMVKPSARLINVARGGVIDEQALFKAVEEGRIAGAAIDVFSEEPTTDNILLQSEKIVVTPHLGASTVEAQTGVAVDVAEQALDVLEGGSPAYAVNAPIIPAELREFLTPFFNIASMAGKLVSYLSEGQINALTIKYEGEIAYYETDALKAATLGGLLEATTEERVSLVNANYIAQSRGIKVVEQKSLTCENYNNLITVEVNTNIGTTTVAGTIMRGEPHIVRVYDYWVDIVPTGAYWLFADHKDRPGLIGSVGEITGKADVDISYMYVARMGPRGRALMVLNLDEPLSEAYWQKIAQIPDVYSVKVVKL